MNSRERMIAAIDHHEPDRVPKGELCIEAGLANRLLQKDYPTDYQHFERDRAVRELLNIDFVNLGDWPNEYLGRDKNGYHRYKSAYGHEFVSTGLSCSVVKPAVLDIANARYYKKPDIKKVNPGIIRRFREETELFVIGQVGGPVSMLDEMFPMEDYLVYCLTNTIEMRIIGEKVMEYEVEKAKLFLDAGADAIIIADDIAFNAGPFLPPGIMDEIVYPFYRSAINEIKRHKDVPLFFHSDGDLHTILERLVSCGFNGLHSLQPSAGMDIAQVKKDYGDVLTLIGNIDLDYIMTMASASEVFENVRQTIEEAAPGGGYILSTCNTLVDAIPECNALAMYEAGSTFGIYEKGELSDAGL